MNKIDKKILHDIDVLTKAMEKNNLSEIEFSDESISLKLKNLQNLIQIMKLIRK